MRMETNPTFPKALGVIQLRGELTGQQRKALNWLLYNAHDRISEHVVHEARLSDLRQYLGNHESNDRVKQITTRLASTIVKYDCLNEEGWPKWAAGSLIQISGSTKTDKILYEFPHWARPRLAGPAKWARLSLRIAQKLSGKYALVLYEILEANANKASPLWKIDVEDFRDVLGVPEGKLKSFNDLHRRVIQPALAQINEHANFTAKCVITQRDGRRVMGMRFEITKKASRIEDEKVAQYHANGSQPSRTANIQLRSDTFDKVRRAAPRADVYKIEADWREWIADKEAPRNPDGAFIRFAKKWHEKRQGILLH